MGAMTNAAPASGCAAASADAARSAASIRAISPSQRSASPAAPALGTARAGNALGLDAAGGALLAVRRRGDGRAADADRRAWVGVELRAQHPLALPPRDPAKGGGGRGALAC
eukprot:gene10171-biopygen5114